MADLALKINKPIIYTIRSVEEEDFKIRGIEITPEGLENIKTKIYLLNTQVNLLYVVKQRKK